MADGTTAPANAPAAAPAAAAGSDLVTEQHIHDATITIRLVKSFEYRTVKPLVLHNIDLTTLTPIGLLELVAEGTPRRFGRNVKVSAEALAGSCAGDGCTAVATRPGYKPFRNVEYGTAAKVLVAMGNVAAC